jgi:hypothetical protein
LAAAAARLAASADAAVVVREAKQLALSLARPSLALHLGSVAGPGIDARLADEVRSAIVQQVQRQASTVTTAEPAVRPSCYTDRRCIRTTATAAKADALLRVGILRVGLTLTATVAAFDKDSGSSVASVHIVGPGDSFRTNPALPNELALVLDSIWEARSDFPVAGTGPVVPLGATPLLTAPTDVTTDAAPESNATPLAARKLGLVGPVALLAGAASVLAGGALAYFAERAIEDPSSSGTKKSRAVFAGRAGIVISLTGVVSGLTGGMLTWLDWRNPPNDAARATPPGPAALH